MSLTESISASKLLSQTNELLANITLLNSNVQLYRQVRSLEEDLNALEKMYESLIKTSTCNAQCEKLNTKSDENSVDNFLMGLLLSKSNSTLPSAPLLVEEISTSPNPPL